MSTSNPRILYVITDLERGGVPLHLLRLARRIRDRGFDPQIISLATPGEVGRMLLDDRFVVHSCDARGVWDLGVLGRLTRVLREVEPDIAHGLLFHANVALRAAALEAAFPRFRVLCELQTAEVERRWHLWVDRWMYRFCRVTIGNSPSVIDHLTTRAGIPRDRLYLIEGGIDPTSFAMAAPLDRGALGLPSDASIVLWVGRLDPVKGLDVLIDSFAKVARDRGVHLLLAGEGPQREQLTRQVNGLALTGRVHFLGSRMDVPSLLKTADVFAFPSRTEGLPNALLEAMAAGCAIVTTDVAGCRDVIEHERSGLLVPSNDTSELTRAIRRLLNDPALSRRLGTAARETVNRRWTSKRMMDSYEAIYKEVLDDRRTYP